MSIRNNIGVLAGVLVLGMSIPTLAASTAASDGLIVCVDWTTKEIKYSKYWEQCPSRTTALELGAVGPQGPQGEAGPAGAVGPAGPAGANGASGSSGSSFRLTDFPTLEWLAGAIEETDCDNRWNAIISLMGNGGGNIISDEFGQPLRNKDFALELAGTCPYIYPEIFENPKVLSITNIVYGPASPENPAAGSIYEPYIGNSFWVAPVTSFSATFSLDSGYSLCTSSDEQYGAFNLTQDSYFTETGPGQISFSGNAELRFMGASPESDDYGYLYTSAADYSPLSVKFCGADSSTPSGLGYKHFEFQLIPVAWSEVAPS